MKNLLLVLLLCFGGTDLFATANTILQTPTVGTISNTTSGSVAYGMSLTTGSTLAIAVTADCGSVPTITVSDATNGTWTNNATAPNAVGVTTIAVIATVHNTDTSALTVNISSTANITGYFQLYEISGPPSSSFIDATNTAPASGAVSLSVSAAANDTIISAIGSNPNGFGADSGYTEDFHMGAVVSYQGAEHIEDAGAAGTKTITWNSYTPDTGNLALAMVAIKSSGGGGGGDNLAGHLSTLGVGR